MGKKIKIICFLLSIILCMITFSGCYDNNEIEDLAYVIAIGIDVSDSNTFNLTFQTAVPKSIAGGEGGGGGGGGGESTDITSFKTDNFLSGIKKANEYLNRKINLSHTKIIVVSEDIAKEGVTAFLNGLQQNIEIRPDVNIIVSSEGAKKYLESIEPKLSSNPAKYYSLLFESYESDFLVPETELEDYLYRAKNYTTQPVAIYTGTDKDVNEASKPSSTGEDSKSDGESKKSGENPKETMSIKGLAVFQMDKMVGQLDPKESTLFALLTGTKNKDIEVTDPLDSRFNVLGNVKKENTSSIRVKIEKGKPKINMNLKLSVDVKAVQSDNDYNDPKKAAELKAAYKDYISNGLKTLLEKVTTEYKSDIFGFGKLAKQNFLTIDEWEKAKWQEIFPQSEYDLNVDVEIMRRG